MGGSCPECRAPVDLGQEFCLECGSAIRLKPDKPKRRIQQSAAPMLVPARRGFPWIPFLVVLALILGGTVLAVLTNNPKPHHKARTSSTGVSTLDTTPTTAAAATITGCTTSSSTTPTTPTTSSVDSATGTTTPSSSSAAPEITPTTAAATGGATAATSTTATAITPEIPSTSSSTTSTVYVDASGNPCPTTTPQTTTTPSTSTGATTPTGSTSTPGTLSQTWPVGQSGWTVVLFSLSQMDYDRQYANERAAEAQADGIAAGVLDTNGFAGMCPDLWYVFHGTYASQGEAQTEQSRVITGTSTYQGAFVRQISTTGTPASCPS